MIKQIDNILWFKLNAALRSFIVRGGCRIFTKHFIINEYPKSGGTWLSYMVSEALNIPFPKNKLPMFKSCVMHGHYLNPFNMKNVCVIWRDGRDIIISQYYHSLFINQKSLNRRLVHRTRRKFKVKDYNDIKTNLPIFIEKIFEKKISNNFNWTNFVDKWIGSNFLHIKYENLRLKTVDELIRVVNHLTQYELDKKKAQEIVDKYSFEKLSGRKPGEENINSFMRKGIVGDWKNYFSQESSEIFDYYAGTALIKLGYENNRNWICKSYN